MLTKTHEPAPPLFQFLPEADIYGQIETFSEENEASSIVRTVRASTGESFCSTMENLVPAGLEMDSASKFDYSWLRSKNPGTLEAARGQITIADLFSGCGGLTLGIVEACKSVGLEAKPVLAMDANRTALDTYFSNFPTAKPISDPIETILDGNLGDSKSATENSLLKELGRVEILIGGPPCQGHSDLNNHTRRNDPKNALYLKMARFAEIFEPAHVLIENVPAAQHDKTGAVAKTALYLKKLGYNVDSVVLNASRLGVAQRRKRFFLVASLTRKIDLKKIEAMYGTDERDLWWACHDLESSDSTDTFDTAAKHSMENTRRIDYLFDNDLYDLPDEQRPDCHKLKPHSYKSVYGRLKWNEAARTITSGFGSMGQGRFVHPSQRRSITPHEAARLQFFPDYFRFPEVGRRALQEMIGNAVPPKLAYVIGLELLR